MLTELRISRFALIDHLTLEFSSGFQVLTGETGAGKSLLVDALLLLLGGRASGEHIRTGAREAVLEAAFTFVDRHPMLSKLQARDLLVDESKDLILRRVLSREGRSRMYVNGTLVPLHQMAELGEGLVDIHGQHEQQSLLSSKVQLDVVDAFGGLLAVREQYRRQYRTWQDLVQSVEELRGRAAKQQEREEFLHFQADELRKAHLTPGEDETLTHEHHRLQNSGRVLEIVRRVYALVYEDQRSVLAQLTEVKKLVRELETIDRTIHPWREFVESSQAQVEELALATRRYTDGFDHDPQRLAQIDERLALLQRLKKKYRLSLEELIERQTRIQSELDELADLDERVKKMQQNVTRAYEEARVLGQKLSESRRIVARRLEEHVVAELAQLKMERSIFRIQLTTAASTEDLGPYGVDQIEFAFCANQGESVQPLARVASGGELSRLMLAMKTALARVDHVPVLIFDEVDAGIGGDVAAAMGQRLNALGRTHQVLCITHLPQIAAQAHAHYRVAKERVRKRTITTVAPLHGKEREEEIARMLGGATITPTVRKAAGEMLNAARLT